MNPYTTLTAGQTTLEATALAARLSAWHDAMVAHERRLRSGLIADACDDECPHAEAPALWSEAVATFGLAAQELAFLRSRAEEPPEPAGFHRGETPEARIRLTPASPFAAVGREF